MSELGWAARALARHSILLVLGMLVVGGAMFVSMRQHPSTYQASVVIGYEWHTLLNRSIDAGDVAYQASTVQSYVAAPISPDMVATAQGALAQTSAPERSVTQILAEVHLSVASNQPGIVVTAKDTDAQVVVLLANEIAIGFVNHYTQAAAQTAAIDPRMAQLQAQVNADTASVASTQADLTAAQSAHRPTAALTAQLTQQQLALALDATNLDQTRQSILDAQPVFVVATFAQNAQLVSYGVVVTTSLGTLAGLLAGMALALLLEYLNGTIRGPKDIERWAGLTTLAIAPDAPRSASPLNALAVTPALYAGVAQPFRRLVIGLRFATVRRPQQTLLVAPVDNTSTRRWAAPPAEDWSAINLAITYALAGQRTLIIDANWGHPTLEARFGLPAQELGLFTCLADLAAAPWSATVPVVPTHLSHLVLLPLGTPPPRTSDLLEADVLDTLFSRLRRDYPQIVVLAPDDLASATGKRLVDQMDCGMLVTRSGETSGAALRHLTAMLHATKLYVAGTIVLASPKDLSDAAAPLATSGSAPGPFPDGLGVAQGQRGQDQPASTGAVNNAATASHDTGDLPYTVDASHDESDPIAAATYVPQGDEPLEEADLASTHPDPTRAIPKRVSQRHRAVARPIAPHTDAIKEIEAQLAALEGMVGEPASVGSGERHPASDPRQASERDTPTHVRGEVRILEARIVVGRPGDDAAGARSATSDPPADAASQHARVTDLPGSQPLEHESTTHPLAPDPTIEEELPAAPTPGSEPGEPSRFVLVPPHMDPDGSAVEQAPLQTPLEPTDDFSDAYETEATASGQPRNDGRDTGVAPPAEVSEAALERAVPEEHLEADDATARRVEHQSHGDAGSVLGEAAQQDGETAPSDLTGTPDEEATGRRAQVPEVDGNEDWGAISTVRQYAQWGGPPDESGW